jgi:chromate reductase
MAVASMTIGNHKTNLRHQLIGIFSHRYLPRTIEVTIALSGQTMKFVGTGGAPSGIHSTRQEEPMTTHKVGYLIGSLAKESINRKLAKALVRLAPPELELWEISFKELPLYSYDYDADYPPAGKAFKAAIAGVDAVLFVTPEYNRSIPGGLKNAIDWASRPYGTNSFTRKPSAVIGTSPGAIGTAVAQQSLRSVLGFCNSPQMNAPEAYIHFTPGLITDGGEVTNDSTAEFLPNFMKEFHIFIARVRSTLPKDA